MDKHFVICSLKELAIEQGKTPTRDEFAKHIPRNQVDKMFGGYAQLVAAAGLEPTKNQNKQKFNPFKKDLQKQLDEYRAKKDEHPSDWIFNRTPDEWILLIGDVHSPFTLLEAMMMILVIAEKHSEKIKFIVFMGDIYDMFCKSRFARSQNIYGPKEEVRLGREILQDFINKLKKACPNAKILIQLGNHDIRPIRMIMDKAPEMEEAAEDYMKKIFTFDNSITNYDYRQEMIIGDWLIHHGYYSGIGKHRDYNMMNTAVGHTHHGGVSYRQIRCPINPRKFKIIAELNAGYIGDPASKALGYMPQKASTATIGCGLIDNLGPRFIPF